MRRKIYIQNDLGSRIALNGENGITIVDSTGFGVDTSEDFADIGHGFFSPVRTDKYPQQSVAGTLMFQGLDTFAMYKSFADFLMRSARLYIVAELVSGAGAYMKEVRINFLTKGERKKNYLEVPVSFISLTPWFQNVKLNIRLDRAPAVATRFGTSIFGSGLFTAAFDSGFTTEIPVNGQLPAVLELTFAGSVSNPRIELRGQETGKLLCRCAVSATLSAGDRLEYSANPVNAYIRKVSAGGTVTDLMDRVDPSSDPFALIPISEPSLLTFSGDAEPDGSAEASIRYYYRSI